MINRFKSVADVQKYIREFDIKMVDFKMVDLEGRWRHLSIPVERFTEKTMEEGIGFDGSNYGYAPIEKSDMVFIPNLKTAIIDKFSEIPTITMMGAAVLAVKENTDLPLMVTMSFEESGRTFLGTGLENMAMVLQGLGADAIGINCSLGPAQILPLIKELMTYTDLPVIAKPNAGLPNPATGKYDIDCDEFVEIMKQYVDAEVEYRLYGSATGERYDDAVESHRGSRRERD